mmetsp:Transcript_31803/g.95203  ORF Transcript_31803/g.95203 Transcript_31803/m.95203 type:complete len:192 (-) Transcript_31803:405-980(-)
MLTATDGLYEERKSVFYAFGLGLCMTVGSVVICVWLFLSPEAALVCMSITVATGFKMYSAYLRVTRKFTFDESETVDFTDIFEGPAAIKATSTRNNDRNWIRKRKDGDVGKRSGDMQIKMKTSNRSCASSEYASSSSSDETMALTRGRERNHARRRSPRRDDDSSRTWKEDYDIESGSDSPRKDLSHMQTV